MANTKNLKTINEYKRVFRDILDSEGLGGITLRGTSRTYADWIYIHARAEMNIELICEGQKVKIVNHMTHERLEFDLADPASTAQLREFFKADAQRMTNGAKR